VDVILLDNIRNLGKLGHTKTVARGYARNYLIPQGKALPATAQNKAFFEAQRQQLEQQAQAKLQEAQQQAAAFQNFEVRMSVEATPEGKLFGAIKLAELLKEMADKGHTFKKNQVRLEETIRELGQYTFEIHFHPEVVVTGTLVVQQIQKSH
jgi:large subunit ribosomal protein L9